MQGYWYRRRANSTTDVPTKVGDYYDWTVPNNPVSGSAFSVLKGTKGVVYDDKPTGWNWRPRPVNAGGFFYLNRTYFSQTPSAHIEIVRPGFGTAYKGQLTRSPYKAGMDTTDFLGGIQIPDMDTLGPEAVARSWPDKPSFNFALSAFELRELPQMLRQRFLTHYKGRPLNSIGDYYLALKFGWEPLLRDVRDFTRAALSVKDSLDQLKRDEGKTVRRSGTLSVPNPPQNDFFSGTTFGGQFEQEFVSQCYAGDSSYSSTTTFSNRVWYSARSRYWLPSGPRDWRWNARMIAKILGVTPSPLQVWRAIPWSWLIDWGFNTASVIENLQGGVSDRRSLDYCYLMNECKVDRVVTGSAPFHTVGGGQVNATAVYNITHVLKRRVGADPFGFGSKQNDLSGTQNAILGALGLSRLPAFRSGNPWYRE